MINVIRVSIQRGSRRESLENIFAGVGVWHSLRLLIYAIAIPGRACRAALRPPLLDVGRCWTNNDSLLLKYLDVCWSFSLGSVATARNGSMISDDTINVEKLP